MLVSPHAAVGAALGTRLPTPLVVPVAVCSHFILDRVPHWQETLYPYKPTYKTWLRMPLDLALAASLTHVIAARQPQKRRAVWLGALAATLPDTDSALALWSRGRKGLLGRYWDWHCSIQRETASWTGLVTQGLTIALALASSTPDKKSRCPLFNELFYRDG